MMSSTEVGCACSGDTWAEAQQFVQFERAALAPTLLADDSDASGEDKDAKAVAAAAQVLCVQHTRCISKLECVCAAAVTPLVEVATRVQPQQPRGQQGAAEWTDTDTDSDVTAATPARTTLPTSPLPPPTGAAARQSRTSPAADAVGSTGTERAMYKLGRRERNRLAVDKYRKKSQYVIAELQQQVAALLAENQRLREVNAGLEQRGPAHFT